MAKYGDQQNLPSHCLKNGGILGELMKDPCHPDIRFVAPIEILLCLGCSQSVLLPKNQRLGWHIVGNAIHEYHALFGLLTVWNFLRFSSQSPQLDFLEALVRHQSKCWVARQVDSHPDPSCPDVLLVHGDKPDLDMTYITSSFQHEDDVHEPPTKRLRRDCAFACQDVPCQHGSTCPEVGQGSYPLTRSECPIKPLNISNENAEGTTSTSDDRQEHSLVDTWWDDRRKGTQADAALVCPHGSPPPEAGQGVHPLTQH